jgi:hypothetical protein
MEVQMRLVHSPVTVALCALAASTLIARADWFKDESPPPNAKPLSTVIKSLEDRGMKTITEVSFDDGKWKIEVHQAGGKETTVRVDAMSGQIVPR